MTTAPTQSSPAIGDAASLAKIIREEIVRQYRDDERGKCPLGAPYYEAEISPYLIAEVVLKTLTPTPSPASGERDEFGWLIEVGGSNGRDLEYFDGLGWTKNHLEAVRHCRKEDAERVAAGLDHELEIRCLEHAWVNPAALSSTTAGGK